jgi:hypothetical protein
VGFSGSPQESPLKIRATLPSGRDAGRHFVLCLFVNTNCTSKYLNTYKFHLHVYLCYFFNRIWMFSESMQKVQVLEHAGFHNTVPVFPLIGVYEDIRLFSQNLLNIDLCFTMWNTSWTQIFKHLVGQIGPRINLRT